MIIYKITNLINNKMYVGQTIKSIQDRFNEHKNHAYRDTLKYHLYNAIRKYGVENFCINELKRCDSKDEMDYWESYFIEKFDVIKNGYNIANGGTGCRGYTHSKTSREQITESLTRYWEGVRDGNIYRREITRAHSKETILKMKLSKIGHNQNTIEVKQKISNSLKGRECTWRDKISKSKKQYKFTDDHISNIKLSAMSREKYECIYCHKKMTIQNIKRWHNENCKRKNL